MICEPPVIHEMSERPPGYIAPNLSPLGLELHPHQLDEGVYALMANEVPKDNNGLVVGDRAALVIDSGVTPGVGRHIQEVAARLTDKPVRYLANTTYHGDHTFGNTAFGPEVTVFSSRVNKAAMADLDAEKRIRVDSMYGDDAVLDEVVTWRKPDVVFDRFGEIDLGGRVAQLWHFGPGNGSGDTIVYVPDAKVAWTGNFIGPAGIPPMMLIGDPSSYTRSIRAMRATLDIDTFVPGHGFAGPAEPGTSGLLTYLEHVAASVSRRKEAGESVTAMYEEITMRGIEPPPGVPEGFMALLRSFHRLNILLTYRWMEGVDAA
ncbi:MAG: MBL fold metallo-hydrolase [Streptosporangiales bacterium]|nr:MBL fold metallo-hydrolase [Streptosporangiales bacterium]